MNTYPTMSASARTLMDVAIRNGNVDRHNVRAVLRAAREHARSWSQAHVHGDSICEGLIAAGYNILPPIDDYEANS